MDEFRFQKRNDGFYEPDIKSWNIAAGFAKEIMKETWTLMGAIDDLACENPGEMENFVRVRFRFSRLFGAAVIHRNLESLGSSTDYWLEVWPDANYPNEILIETPEVVENRFRLSDPRIRRCYQLTDCKRGYDSIIDILINNYNVVMGEAAKEAGKDFVPKPFGAGRKVYPVYIHGEGDIPYFK